MDGKKISFGFMKTKKVDKPLAEEKKEFIESIEEKSIKVVGGEEIEENTPLVIAMKPNTLITAERLKEIAQKVESALDEPEPSDKPPSPKDKPPENETLEQMAVRELLETAKKEVKVDVPQFTVPLPGKSITDGEKESTLDDYESVPIQDFGLAMLRGMGWTQNNEKSKYKPPTLRPKGLGLGADKVVKDNQKKNQNQKDKDEELSIVKNAYVKIASGKHSGYYGKVVSLDEDNGRVVVDIAVKKETVSLSEFMMLPVSKSVYDKESKVINANTYEEYKKNENTSQSLKSDKDKSNKDSKENKSKYSDSNKNPDYAEKESSSRSYRSPDRKERETREKERDTRGKEREPREKDRDTKEKEPREKERDTREKERETREKDRDRSNRERNRRNSSDERYKKKKSSKRYSSNESLDSLSDTEKKTKKKDKKRYGSNESLSSNERYKNRKTEKKYSSDESEQRSKKEKRDIDKKRKGKKKKRDRDRSPNYRKHRK